MLPALPDRPRFRPALVLAFAAAVAVTLLLLTQSTWPRETAFMAGIFVLAALLWVTEALPLFATALLVIGLQMLLLANPGDWPGIGFSSEPGPGMRDILNAAVDPVLLLFFGGFLLAQAAVKENVDKAMSSVLLSPFGGSPRWTMLGLMLVTALFSMWMSNTATTAMMITLVAPLLAQLPPGEPLRKGLVLCVPFAANIGGMGTPISSPPNAVAVGFLQSSGHPIAFFEWMVVAVPLMLGLLLVTWGILWVRFRPQSAALRLTIAAQPLSPRAKVVVGVFTVTVLLWMSDAWHGLPAPVVALLPAVALTATRIINREDLKQIEWNVLILIAGGIALGAGMQMTGLDQQLVRALPTEDGTSGFWLLAGLIVATLGLGTFMSNTAAANLLLPIGLSSAAMLPAGILSQEQAAMSIALVAALSMALPISTPPNAIAYARSELETKDMATIGLAVGLLGAVLILFLGGPVMRFWGVGG